MSGKPRKRRKLAKWSLLVAANLLVFVFLYSFAEISCRIYRDGLPRAITGVTNDLVRVPYSNLGTSNWVIYDEELGCRLNPHRERFNSRSVPHGEINLDKKGLFRKKRLYRDGIQLNEEGHRFVTRQTLRFLSENHLLPSNRQPCKS